MKWIKRTFAVLGSIVGVLVAFDVVWSLFFADDAPGRILLKHAKVLDMPEVPSDWIPLAVTWSIIALVVVGLAWLIAWIATRQEKAGGAASEQYLETPVTIQEGGTPLGIDDKPLEVSLNPTTDQEGYSWLNLMVTNPNNHSLPNCYGKVRGYRAMSDQHSGHQFPRIGHGFPWQAWSGGGQYRTLAPGSSDLLSLVVARDDRIYTPDPQSRLNFPLPYDSYEAWIEVGSEGNDGIQPTLVTVGIFFDSDSELRGEVLPF